MSLWYCTTPGCRRRPYRDGACRGHWAEPPERTCGHRPLILCGCCNRRVCAACYGHWKALACLACRDAATRAAGAA